MKPQNMKLFQVYSISRLLELNCGLVFCGAVLAELMSDVTDLHSEVDCIVKSTVVISINATKQFWYALQNPKWGSK